jgi:hypothetical protein
VASGVVLVVVALMGGMAMAVVDVVEVVAVLHDRMTAVGPVLVVVTLRATVPVGGEPLAHGDCRGSYDEHGDG